MSFFVTDKAAQAAGDVPLTYVDILYDHAGYLKTNNGLLGNGSLAGKAVGTGLVSRICKCDKSSWCFWL